MSDISREFVMRQSSLCSIEQALDDIRNGRMLILVDDEDRNSGGHLVIAAEHVDAAAVNFMARHACGLVCRHAQSAAHAFQRHEEKRGLHCFHRRP